MNSRHSGSTGDQVSTPASCQERYLEVDGLRLRYLDYGAAGKPAMLCIHGGAAHAHWFDFVAPQLSREYHVRSLDLRGHGESAWADPPDYAYARYAADVAEVVRQLDLRDFVLVGHSMGGTVSLIYAALYPGRARALIVADSTLQMSAERIATLREVGTRKGKSYASREEFVDSYRLRPSGSTAAPEVIRHLAQRSVRQNADGTWGHKFDRSVYATREAVDGLDYWNRIAIPALLVRGELSARITPQVVEAVTARCSQVEVATVTGSDHHVTLDNPAGFVEAVRTFLRERP